MIAREFRPKSLGARAAMIAFAGAMAADDLKGALIYGPTCPLQASTKTGLCSGSKTLPRGRGRSTAQDRHHR
jgi:hypothetical protein